jgi:acetylornithine deacetylase/succinyl-diaminopimelate desuccinylase-like protein
MDADVEIDYTARPNASPYETDFASKVKEATYKAIGRRDVMWLPSLVIGFTDSRLVRPLGNIVYNFSPGNPDSESAKERIHDEDESTDIKGLVIRTNMLVTLACDVLG